MTQPKSIDIRQTLTTLLPEPELRELAEQYRFIRRRRKIDPVAMLWTLAFGFGAGTERTLASLRRLYERASGTRLAAASFHARFDAALVRFSRAANPTIIRSHLCHRGRAVRLEGCKLDEVVRQLKREVLDVEVEVKFKRRVYKGKRRMARGRLRLVGVRDPSDGLYWFYLTNIAPEAMEAKEIAELYACRWQAELVFRELKGRYGLDELPSRKEEAVEALILASVISLLASRELLRAVRERLGEERRRVREERWASLMATVGTSVLEIVLLPARVAKVLAERLEAMLLHEAPDPNIKRLSLLERVDSGRTWAHKAR